MMCAGQTRVTEAQNRTDLARQSEQKRSCQHEQGPIQPVAPQAAYQRAEVNCNGLTPADLLGLQCTVGNRHVQRMLEHSIGIANDHQQDAPAEERHGISIRTKLTVGTPNDTYEQEADRVADQVMQMANPTARSNSAELHHSLISEPLKIDRQPKGPMKPTKPAAKPGSKSSGVTIDEVKESSDNSDTTSDGNDSETKIGITFKGPVKWDKEGKIKSFSLVVSRNIQTTFLPGVDPQGNSGYGRGTTDEDKAAGNTSLSFHESCHRKDNKRYLHDNPLPGFTGKKGMTKAEWKNAITEYETELTKYVETAKQLSEQQTDCVGTTYDQYNKTHGRSRATKCTP